MQNFKIWKVQWANSDWVEILESTTIAMPVPSTPERAADHALHAWLDDGDVELDPSEDEVSLLFRVLDPEGQETKVEVVATRNWQFHAKRI
jgi:hypothetical protein